MNKSTFLAFLFSGIFVSSGAFCKSIDEAFSFNHYKLHADSEISAAYLNSPITEKDRIIVSEDGHLEANGKRIRIFGTNLSEFPTSHKQAEFSAKALANQGYNCIRFHHTDANWTNCFLRKEGSGKWVVNEERLDDFDYFFAQLKQNGIYSNLNLLTGRDISNADGYSDEINEVSGWKSRHCLGFWNENAKKLQQDWAEFLLNHVNPYTKTSYKDDPAVAIVEINNENGLLMGYLAGWLEDYKGDYWQELEDKWNVWLKKNNQDYSSLSEVYNKSVEVSDFLVDKNSFWNMENHDSAKAVLKKNGNVSSIKVVQNGTEAWHIQYNCSNLKFTDDKIYTIKFAVRSSKSAKINVSLMQAHSPWQSAGWASDIPSTTRWTEYSYTVQNISTDNNLRLNFGNMGLSSGTTFYFKDVQVFEGGNVEVVKSGKKTSKNEKTVLLPHFEEYKTLPSSYKNLILSFLYETEENYWISMKKFVSDTLKSKALIMGTSAGCSTAALQSCFDIIDSHAYWNHPAFPETDWDMGNYYVNNYSLTKADGNSTIFNLAKSRVYGKPFSVTEYDHPFPNQYSSEMYPMFASFAAFQDWDCIFTFCSALPYNTNGQKQKITGYFDQSNNPVKSCAAPFSARIFREFLVEPTPTRAYINLSREIEMQNLYKFSGWNIGSTEEFGIIPEISAFYQLGINLKDVTPDNFDECGTEISLLPSPYFDSSSKKVKGFDQTEQIYWDEDSGVFIVCNKNLTISVLDSTAKLPEFPEKWKSNLLPMLNSEKNDFYALSAIKSDDSYIIFSSSWSGNSGENLKIYGKKNKSNGIIREPEKVTTLSTLGRGPAKTLCGNCTFTLPGSHTLYKAGLEGNKTEKIKENSSDFSLNSSYQTLWFVLE